MQDLSATSWQCTTRMEEMMIDDYVVSAAQALMAATVCAVVASRVSRERRVRGIESIESSQDRAEGQ